MFNMKPAVLNVAGPRESKCPGIEASATTFVKELIEKVYVDSGFGIADCLEQRGRPVDKK